VIRSKAITQSAKGESCALCGRNKGTTVFAHSNMHCHGKGRGLKAHDLFGAYLCYECHTAYDTGMVGNNMFAVAMAETQLRLVEKGIVTIKGCEPDDAMSKILPRPMC
jgi:Putative nuclease YbcO